MGRTKKYATPEEAHQAKLRQMRENYQKRKAEKEKQKAEAIARGETPPEPEKKPKTPTKRKYLTWDDIPQIIQAINSFMAQFEEEEEEEVEVLPSPLVGGQ